MTNSEQVRKSRWKPLKDRFESRVIKDVDENKCWGWVGSKSAQGYGSIHGNGRANVASRVSYELHIGPIPEGMLVCHHCDNRECCNPKHLFLGTYKDNSDDKFSKGRQAPPGEICKPGSLNGYAKLTESQVLEIRELYSKGGVTMKQLGEKYGVTRQAISEIIRRKNWKHL